MFGRRQDSAAALAAPSPEGGQAFVVPATTAPDLLLNELPSPAEKPADINGLSQAKETVYALLMQQIDLKTASVLPEAVSAGCLRKRLPARRAKKPSVSPPTATTASFVFLIVEAEASSAVFVDVAAAVFSSLTPPLPSIS